jgi:hypothetical protein
MSRTVNERMGRRKEKVREAMKTHKDLDIWKSLDLVTDIYKRTKNFPMEET